MRSGGQGIATSCLTGTIKTEVSSRVHADVEKCSPIDVETAQWAIQRGILKTVEVDVASESGH